MLDNREKIEQLENEVKEKQEEIEISNSQTTIDNLNEEIYNTKQSIEELKKHDGSKT
jgi:prefoldin subunit 5|tara:strand:- start:2448 stop:2618 length:171 start_codon:yes stop_codon:yes gene_type:complete